MATAMNMAMLILVRVAAIAERAIVGHSVGRSHYRYWGSGLWRPAKGSQDHQGKRRRRFRTDLARLLVAKVVIRVCTERGIIVGCRRMGQAFSTMVLALQHRLRGMNIGLMESALQEEREINLNKPVFSSGSA